jgi:hypothetical protein
MTKSIVVLCIAAMLVLCVATSASAKEPVFPGHEPEFIFHELNPPTVEFNGAVYRGITIERWLRTVNEYNEAKAKLKGMMGPKAIQFEDPAEPPKEATFKWVGEEALSFTLGASGRGKITGEVEKSIDFTVEFKEGPTCTYSTSKININYAISNPPPVPWEPAITKQKFKVAKGSDKGCPKAAYYSAALDVTTVEPEEPVLIEK